MLSKKSTIEKKFEQEIWLYLDGDLPKERIEFWDEQLAKNTNLKNNLDTNKLLLSKSKNDTPELDNEQFDNMLQTAVQSNENVFTKFIERLKDTTSSRYTYYKLAFGSIIIIVALTVSLIDRNPNPINKISDELLEWDNKEITNGITKVENALFNRNEEYKEYIKYQMSKDPWKRNISSIEKRINKMKNEIEQTSL